MPSLSFAHKAWRHLQSILLCLQELFTYVFIGLQALLMGKNDLFLAFHRPVKAICAAQRLQKAVFCPFLLIVLA